jgi:hypothetical protein
MAKERKRIEKKPVNAIIPKKREEPKKKITAKTKVEPKKESPVEEPKEPKESKLPYKIVKICEGSKQEEYKAIVERVQRGEIKWLYYATDGNKGCQYYQVIKKV